MGSTEASLRLVGIMWWHLVTHGCGRKICFFTTVNVMHTNTILSMHIIVEKQEKQCDWKRRADFLVQIQCGVHHFFIVERVKCTHYYVCKRESRLLSVDACSYPSTAAFIIFLTVSQFFSHSKKNSSPLISHNRTSI